MASNGADAPTPTKTLYQYDETLRDHLTKVRSVRPFDNATSEERSLFKTPTENTYILETEETIFYVQGGGQPFDTGYMSASGNGEKEQKFNVEAVRYAGSWRVLHFGHFSNGARPFEQGDMVQQHIDGERRDLHSRIHTAGHLVALAVRRLAETIPELDVIDDKAQHYLGASFVEFKGIIEGRFKDVIQEQSNKFVSEALPVKLYWRKPEELNPEDVILAPGMPILSGPDGMVRVVDIVGAGAYPCGGTHVPDSSYVGAITVRNIKRQKGISKVSYEVAEKTA